MKKFLPIFLTLMFTPLLASCTSAVSHTPEATPEPILTSELAEYTIVYPSAYTQFRMDIVTELQDTIEHITGKKINAVPDSQPEAEHEIILASSKRKTSYDSDIDAFASRMDYIIAVDGDDIVLGGQNYYSDLRAVYDFINNYIGYDDIKDAYSEPTKAISGTYVNIYKKPDFIIEAACWATTFDKAEYIKDIAEANFNMLMILQNFYKQEQFHDLTKWCARYEIELLVNVVPTNNEMRWCEVYSDCPIIYGGYVWDEPSLEQLEYVQELCDQYSEAYSQYGWKPYMNYGGMVPYAQAIKESPYLKNLEVLSFDWYIFVNNSENWSNGNINGGEGTYFLEVLQTYMETAKENDMELWQYIQAYRRSGGAFNASKAYRWQMYMSLCFDVKAILYFEYANQFETLSWADNNSWVLNKDFSKGDNYYYAKDANEEILKIYDVLKNYDNVGAYTYYKREDQYYAEFDEYKDFNVIEDIKDLNYDTFGNSSYLVGCFDEKEGDGKAFIFMNLEIPNSVDYEKDWCFPVSLKINGDNVTFYKGGEPIELEPDEEGYYTIKVPNGECLFVTVE